jgi:pyruvate formate lyase activating enzyme
VIGGLQPCSFVDDPGRLSAVVFVQGCNLRCPYCHNPELIGPCGAPVMTLAELRAFLASRRGLLDGVVVTGGEPTLHPDLPGLLRTIRDLGFAVKLDTNGTRPGVLADLLEAGLLDTVAMDLKDEPRAYAEWLGMQEPAEVLLQSLQVIRTSGVDAELRTTVVAGRHDQARLRRMAQAAAGIPRWVLQPCRPHDKTPAGQRLQAPGHDLLERAAEDLRLRYGVRCSCRWARATGEPIPRPASGHQGEHHGAF